MTKKCWVKKLQSFTCLSFLMLALLTLGCSQNSGEAQRVNIPAETQENTEFTYQGNEKSATEDVQNFLNEVWKKLAPDNRCGACHFEGEQAPFFTHRTNINEAYAEANRLVDLELPSQSRLVTKVAEGHNCWRQEPALCADTIAKYIEAWASVSGTVSNEIEFVEPNDKEVGTSLSFPSDPSVFGQLIHTPYLVKYCSECHAENAPTPQQPYFASDDLDAAYAAVRSKINLDSPALSRLVIRLRDESHHCWEADGIEGNCSRSSAIMQAKIQEWIDGGDVQLTEVDPALLTSKALTFTDGMIVSAGGRVESDVIALYEFRHANPDIAFDTSDVEPELNLHITGNVRKLDSWGVQILDGRLQGATSASAKLQKLIKATGEYTVEAWVVPANVSQEGPARIVAYSGSLDSRNFTLGQTLYNYDFMNRSSVTDKNGQTTLSTPTADEVLQATLQHVVLTFDPINGRKIFVNGEIIVDEDPQGGGDLNEWDDSFALILGRETNGDYLWQGSVRLLAIHNRALQAENVRANYDVGVGEKRFLLFDVTEHVDIPRAYIGMRVQIFDDYSYLFDAPFFISLDNDAMPQTPIDIRGMRIGMNGRETIIGQAFAHVNASINADNYSSEGTTLSTLGTLVPIDKGVQADEFFLSFDHIGGEDYARPAEQTPPIAAPKDPDMPSPDIGLRTFEEIHHTLSVMTGVPMTNTAVVQTYEAVKQQLPSVEHIDGFLAAHQMGVTQLAVKYCNTLSNTPNLRSAFFPGFDFSVPAANAFDTDGRALITAPLLRALVSDSIVLEGSSNATLTTQPSPDIIAAELDSLFDQMTVCGANCSSNTTANTVTAVCAAALGSAVMLIH